MAERSDTQGLFAEETVTPWKGKSVISAMNNAFALPGRYVLMASKKPRALPWAVCFWAFSPNSKLYGLKFIGIYIGNI